MPSGLSFLRDARGAEVDLLVETGDRLLAVEVKSGQTLAVDFFSGFEKPASALKAAAGGRAPENVLVYGGDTAQRRSAATIVPWHHVATWSTRNAGD